MSKADIGLIDLQSWVKPGNEYESKGFTVAVFNRSTEK